VSELEHLPVRPAYRTMRVLKAVGASPRSNTRETADAAGLRDEGQISKLLRRLEQRGLVENVGLRAAYGEPNEWLVTAAGERFLEAALRPSAADAGRPRGRRLVRGAA
jgi:DNA-binding MarR family transcriptional regulator